MLPFLGSLPKKKAEEMVPRNTMMWRKSSFCSDNACVEVAFDGDVVALRDGKNPNLAELRFTRTEWVEFVRGVEKDEFRPF
ncbi:DUF397 domain-containing protein [Actinoplanes sp. NPDC051513]|uniref:DUF397 domain-containing protein n=1 Tax=Actinoplanes sp. NPDC051513 TaxID=3363908 RepID=UPI00379F6174